MSLLDFPPLNTDGRPYALQEFNGRIITGNIEEFSSMTKCEFLADYPFIERTHLNNLQHSISKDNVRNAFVFKETDKMSQAWDKWNSEGLSGVVDHLTNVTATTNLWPVAKLGRGVLRVRNGFASLASKFMPFQGQEKIDELLQQFAGTINWKNNWLRCFVVHEDGRRLAVCQVNNYIRIYGIGPGAQKTPLTLKHPLQLNVTSMAWQPFDQRVLAVATESRILIWRLNVKAANIKPSAQCAQVIDLSFGPISQIIWDRTTSSSILAISPNSTKIMIVDTSNGEIDSFGAWTGGNITRLIPTVDGRRIAILYTGNLIRVYDRHSWREEKWGSLAGKATAAVWSPSGNTLLFATEKNYQIYAISFVAKTEKNAEGQTETRWLGDLRAKPIFDVSPVEFDPSELEIEGAKESEILNIGGNVHSIIISPDGQRLAINYKENAEVISLFIVDWHPTVRLTPSGFVRAPMFGFASFLSFQPVFDNGSLLTIVWSGGHVQYIPLIYGSNFSVLLNSRTILDEISGRMDSIGEGKSKRGNRSVSDSLRSGELPSSVIDNTENEEIVLFSEVIRQTEKVKDIPP